MKGRSSNPLKRIKVEMITKKKKQAEEFFGNPSLVETHRWAVNPSGELNLSNQPLQLLVVVEVAVVEVEVVVYNQPLELPGDTLHCTAIVWLSSNSMTFTALHPLSSHR